MWFLPKLRGKKNTVVQAPAPSPADLSDDLNPLVTWRGVLLASPLMAGLVIALRLAGGLQLFEWAALDQMYRLRPAEPVDNRIVIVGIDETDIQQLKQWPMSDAVMARLLIQIKQQQPRLIGLDIYRDYAVEPGQAQLLQVFNTTPNLVGIETLGFGGPGTAVAGPPALKQRDQTGFNNVVVDADDKLRRGLLRVTMEGQQLYSFGMQLALMYLEQEGIQLQMTETNPPAMKLGQAVFPRFRPNDGGYVRADAAGYQILLNLRGPAATFRTIPMRQVLNNQVPADLFRDRIVLIGATAISLRDFFSTPYSGQLFGFRQFSDTPSQTPGVEIQANVISHLLSSALDGRSGLQVWGEPWEWAWILLWSCVGGVLSWSLRSPRWTSVTIFLASLALFGLSFLVFWAGWWIPFIPALLAMVSSAVVLIAYIASVDQEERQTVMSLFERHVTPDIAEAIWRDRKQFLQQGRLPGRRLTATVLFTDLKNFTLITEHSDPEMVMAWLNEYLEAMAQIVVAHRGVVDKFIGDSVMAVFGVPIPRTTPEEIAEDARQAVQSAVEMAAKLEDLNQQWQQRGLPTVTMRVGIATGTVVTGSLGGLQKLDYTTIGDCVNVAARLESYDKTFEKCLRTGVCRILINEGTYQYVASHFPTHLVETEQLRGREEQSRIYQVLLPDKVAPTPASLAEGEGRADSQ